MLDCISDGYPVDMVGDVVVGDPRQGPADALISCLRAVGGGGGGWFTTAV